MSYIVTGNDGTCFSYPTLGEAQTCAQQLATDYASGKPNCTVTNTSTLYAVIETTTVQTNLLGIDLTNTLQNIVARWYIELALPGE